MWRLIYDPEFTSEKKRLAAGLKMLDEPDTLTAFVASDDAWDLMTLEFEQLSDGVTGDRTDIEEGVFRAVELRGMCL